MELEIKKAIQNKGYKVKIVYLERKIIIHILDLLGEKQTKEVKKTITKIMEKNNYEKTNITLLYQKKDDKKSYYEKKI